MSRNTRYSPELRERAVRMAIEKRAADSGGFRTPIPIESGHPFRGFRTPEGARRLTFV
jgi:hypothetical protein